MRQWMKLWELKRLSLFNLRGYYYEWDMSLFFFNGGSLRITSTVNVKSSVCSAEPETNEPEANKPQCYLSSKENPGKVVLRRPNIDDYTSGKSAKSGGRRSSSWIVRGDVSDPWQTLGGSQGEEGTA